MILIYVLLAIIAFILWKIYRQRDQEKEEAAAEKIDAEWEAKKKEEFKAYPHLIGKIDYTWLEIFGKLQVEQNIPHLKEAFLIYLKEANNTKLDMMEVDMLSSSIWNLMEEMLEHLEKYHESTKYEYEIAIVTYWQLVAEKADEFMGKDLETIQKMFRAAPFTDIQQIPSWFPKKEDHPDNEMTFTDENGNFPRESDGSKLIDERLKALGL